jgi:hypothetical protein
MATLLELEQRLLTPIIFNQIRAEVSREEINLRRLLEAKGHRGVASLLTWEGLKEHYRVAKDLAFRNANYEFREGPIIYEDTLLRFIPARLSAPAMVRTNEGRLIRGYQGRTLSATHFALSEEGIDHILVISRGTGRSVSLGGKPEYKNLVGPRGELLLSHSDRLDLDGMIFYSPDTPRESTTHEYLVDHTRERLDPNKDLVVFAKNSTWRGESATRTEFGLGIPDSPSYESWGHLYHPKHEGSYDPYGSFMAQIMEATDLSRFVFPVWLPNGKIVFVEVDRLWEHRQNPKIVIKKGENYQELRLALAHWPGRSLNNLGETYFDMLHLLEECTSGDAIPLFDFKANGPIDLEPFKDLSDKHNRSRANEAFFGTGKWVQINVFHRIANNPNIITRGDEEVETRLTIHTLESMEHDFEADQWLAQNLWSSPEDSLMGTGGFEELYPEIYELYLINKAEFDKSAVECPVGTRTGFIRFAKIVKEKLDSEEALIRAFTPLPFTDNKDALVLVQTKLKKLGLIS